MQDRRTILFLLLVWPITAFAHTGGGEAIGFWSGLKHRISGLDHILAMVAVGLWGAQLGPPAVWLLPVTFPIVMAFGGMLGLMGVKLPSIEVCIALSAVALGLMVLREAKPNLWAAAFLVGFFAIFHGHAHGTELPPGANGVLYSIGFVIAKGDAARHRYWNRHSPPLAEGAAGSTIRRRRGNCGRNRLSLGGDSRMRRPVPWLIGTPLLVATPAANAHLRHCARVVSRRP
jgi:urease accessory protein